MASIAHLVISLLLAGHPALKTGSPESISNTTLRIDNLICYIFEYFIQFFKFVNIDFNYFLDSYFQMFRRAVLYEFPSRKEPLSSKLVPDLLAQVSSS
jgi:hypothetical protein